MRLTNKLLLALLAVSTLLSAPSLFAKSINPADYPLRIRVYSKDQTTFYSRREVEEAKGDGRANLFEGDEVHGIDFNYSCSEKLKASFGYETYLAKWKKPGRELTVLLPMMGKANTYNTCDLNVAPRDTVYVRQNGRMSEEPAERFKTWMVKHDYDPVHGKNTPKNLTAADKADTEDHTAPPAQQ
jgi:hypothetical protein